MIAQRLASWATELIDLKLPVRRLKLDAAISEGRLTFEGNQELASSFGQRFVGG